MYAIYNGETFADGSGFGYLNPIIYDDERRAKKAKSALKAGLLSDKFSWALYTVKRELTIEERRAIIDAYRIVRIEIRVVEIEKE